MHAVVAERKGKATELGQNPSVGRGRANYAERADPMHRGRCGWEGKPDGAFAFRGAGVEEQDR